MDLWGPADGQWFHELPIPWVYGDSAPGATGWTTGQAAVTVNGWPAITDGGPSSAAGRGSGWRWYAPDLGDVEATWSEGANDVVFEATFSEGGVATVTRTIYFDPTLRPSTGWLVDIDRDTMALTVAFAPYGNPDPQAGPWEGFLSEATSVKTLPVAEDAAFVLLEPHSGGWPPPRALTYTEFVTVIDKAAAGDCAYCDTPQCDDPCYFGASPWHSFLSPADEFGDPFALLITDDNSIQQIEQIWGP